MNLPNMITIFRLLLTPYIVWLILSESYFLGFLFFVISGISDGLDGFIAKKLNQKTLLDGHNLINNLIWKNEKHKRINNKTWSK